MMDIVVGSLNFPQLVQLLRAVQQQLHHINLISELPQELTVRLARYLDIQSLGRVSCCCKSWNDLFSCADVWRDVCLDMWGAESSKEFEYAKVSGRVLTWKDLTKRRLETARSRSSLQPACIRKMFNVSNAERLRFLKLARSEEHTWFAVYYLNNDLSITIYEWQFDPNTNTSSTVSATRAQVESSISCMSICGKSRLVAIGTKARSVVVYSLESGEQVHTASLMHTSFLLSVHIDTRNDTSLILSGCFSGLLRCIRVPTRPERQQPISTTRIVEKSTSLLKIASVEGGLVVLYIPNDSIGSHFDIWSFEPTNSAFPYIRKRTIETNAVYNSMAIHSPIVRDTPATYYIFGIATIQSPLSDVRLRHGSRLAVLDISINDALKDAAQESTQVDTCVDECAAPWLARVEPFVYNSPNTRLLTRTKGRDTVMLMVGLRLNGGKYSVETFNAFTEDVLGSWPSEQEGGAPNARWMVTERDSMLIVSDDGFARWFYF